MKAWLALVVLASGCSTYDPALLPSREGLRAVPPVEGHRVVVLAPDDRDRAAFEEEARRGPMRLDRRALQDELADALRAVVRGDDAVTVATTEDEALAALERGYDVLLRTRVRRWDAAFLGTNGWWYPNAFFLAWYFFPLGPQWLLADEEFGLDVELEVTAEMASSGRPLPTLREHAVIVATPLEPTPDAPPAFALTDVQRGIDLLGTYFPGDLDEDQWESVGELLGPFAHRHAALGVATAAADALRRFDALPDDARRATAASVHALLLGVEDLGPDHPRAAGAAGDARRLARALTNAGAPARNHVVLENQNASRAATLAALERAARRCGRDDTLVVAFAGRGLRAQDEAGRLGSYSLVLADGELTLEALLGVVQRSPAFRRLVLVDADFDAGPRGATLEGLPGPATSLAEALAARLEPQDVVVLASSSGAESVQVYEDAEGEVGGLLSHYVARALAGEADAGRDGLTIGDLAAWLDLHVPHVALTLARPQRPVVVMRGALAERAGDLLRR